MSQLKTTHVVRGGRIENLKTTTKCTAINSQLRRKMSDVTEYGVETQDCVLAFLDDEHALVITDVITFSQFTACPDDSSTDGFFPAFDSVLQHVRSFSNRAH